MLAELLQLRRNLQQQGISTELSHRDFDKPGLSGYETLKAMLDENGNIRLRQLLSDEAPGVWTLKKGNFKFFPAVRLPNPPIAIDVSSNHWQLSKQPDIDGLNIILDFAKQGIQKIDLSDIRKDQVARILRWNPKNQTRDFANLQNFAKVFQKFSEDPEFVSQEIIRAVQIALTSSLDDKLLKSLMTLLIGSRKEARNKPPSLEYKVQLCFDFRPKDEPSFSLYTYNIKREVLECLNSEASSDPEEQSVACAITGEYIPLLSEPYPDWSAPPVIGKPLKPFSKFSEAPCNYRYHKADSEGFPIGRDTANELISAIKAVTENFKGQAWCSLRNGRVEERNGRKVENQDVLIAYPSFKMEKLAIVNIFAKPLDEKEDGSEEVDDSRESRAIKKFGDLATPVCKAFREKINTESIKPYLILLLIRQISPGQIQLAYSSNLSIPHFVEAIEDWSASADNLPARLTIPLPSKKSPTGFGWFKPNLLFPEDISRLLSHQWIRDGTESTRLNGPPVGMVLDFFLRKPGTWKQLASQLLDLTLSRCGVLLVQAGNRLHRDDPAQLKFWRDFVNHSKGGSDPRYHYAQTLSLIGSLLFAMNSKVEDYTNESAYLVGKFLAMADRLHLCYCKVVRDNDVPNALIGNGLLGRAAESPARALEELLDRMRIYIGWAKSADISKAASEDQKIAIHSARKILRLAEPLAERLHYESSLDKELAAVSKAHLFLGYLSPVFEKEENNSSDEAETKATMASN